MTDADRSTPDRIDLADLEQQRSLGWPDIHPEDYCHRCGERNPLWHAESQAWYDATGMTEPGDGGGVMCPNCFTKAYREAHPDEWVLFWVTPKTREEMYGPAERPTGHRVRLAQRGWSGAGPAETVEDVQVGVKLLWVEIDGHRFTAIVSAAVVASSEEATIPSLLVNLIGPVEIVYVDGDGEPLPGQHTETIGVDDDLPQNFDATTARPTAAQREAALDLLDAEGGD